MTPSPASRASVREAGAFVKLKKTILHRIESEKILLKPNTEILSQLV